MSEGVVSIADAHRHSFSRHAKTAIVAGDVFEAKRLRVEIAVEVIDGRLADANPHFYVTAPGDAVGSRRFDGIVIRDQTYREIMRDPHKKQWYRDSIEARLMPGSDTTIIT